MLAGWGLFNLVEGLIDHHLLHVHPVVERLGVSAWDCLFLASGVVFMIVRWATVRGVGAAPARRGTPVAG